MLKRLLNKPDAKSYAFSFLGNMASAASQWIVLMLLTKLYGTLPMGNYSLAMAWILPLYAFFSLQIRNIHVADQRDSYGFNLFFSIRLLSAGAFLLTTLLIGALFYKDIFTVFLFGGLFKTFEMLSDMIHAEFHKRRQIEVYSKMLIFRSVLAIALNIVLFKFLASYQLALISLPLAYLCSLAIDVRLLKGLNFPICVNFADKRIKKVVATALLTGLSLLLVYMLPGIPRFILEKFRSNFEVGIISGYLALVVFGRIFVQSVVQNSLPRLAAHFDGHNYKGFLAVLKKDALVIGTLGLMQFILVPISNWLYPLIFNADFAGRQGLLSLIFAGSFFSFMAFVLNNGINAMKMFRIQLPVYGAVSALSLMLSYLLIPVYGLNGAALVFLVVNLCTCVLLFIPFYIKIKAAMAAAKKPVEKLDLTLSL
ncbi:hypothetical protein EOD41_12035 [Mucilaginibacter limnophilus]|uniref:Polysaccharide biosynthesis protein n=1 Tax=Mucilaginibacter limnophilus TaxID=1932778 RepID=A0A437MSU1_9SPHI|nr:hypothetical protein [Mucilaginibacter limnophilus]RVU00717.1 hypothetical protein EOD41_12035 [Mucilaginibacter limnophilus]